MKTINKIGDKVFVHDWGKEYKKIYTFENGEKKLIFPIKTKLPNYFGTEYHWKHVYEPNLTLKGTVNKKEPKKLVEKIPVYKNYKWEIVEIFKHPKAGKLHYDLDEHTQEQLDAWKDYSKYTEENLLLLASTHTDKDFNKCYIVIEETGVTELTLEQYNNNQFVAIIQANLNKWDRNTLIKKDVPREIISVFYDEDDNVLFGSKYVKGLVSYEYLDSKFSKDGKPIYLGCSILYDGKGNSEVKDKSKIKPFEYIKNIIEG